MHGQRCVFHDVALAVERIDAGELEQFRGGGTVGMSARPRRKRCGAGADVNLLHGAALTGVVRRAVHEHDTFIHHGYAIGQREDAIDVVLDQQDRNVGRDALNELCHAFALGRGQPRQRLIEQQYARCTRQRQAHVEQSLPAVGERAGFGLLDPRQSEKADQLGRAQCHAFDRVRVGPTIAMRRIVRLNGKPQILLDRYTGKEIRDLKRACKSGADDSMGRQIGYRCPGERHRSAIGHEQARNEIEHCRLARAVRADERMQ